MLHQSSNPLKSLVVLAVCAVIAGCGGTTPTNPGSTGGIGGNGPPGTINDPGSGNVSSTGLFTGSNSGEQWSVCF